MYVIQELHKTYGDKLWDFRILLLNAGGQSQRLPSASVLGKIFTALPIEPFYQVLDLKLALYLPFLRRMRPGFFHAAADTIELYDAGGEREEWSFKESGFTAVAHPSSLQIGKNHGVFVLEKAEPSKDGQSKLVEFRSCREVLQKPSVERMRDRGAVQTQNNPTGSGEHQEFVYTDSYFFFDHSSAKKLLEFYTAEAPLGCEIDSYGDFLQALGPLATNAYTKDVKNVAKVESCLVETREKVFNLLKGTPLNVVLLNSSKFYHLGTMKECLSHFCQDPVLAKEIGFSSHVFSHFSTPVITQLTKRPKQEKKKQGCLIHSLVPESSVLPKNTITEFCHFRVTLTVGANSLVSNCAYTGDDLEAISIPEDTFIHTIAIKEKGENTPKFVTMIFGIGDNLKKIADAETLPYLGDHSLRDALKTWGISVNSVFPNGKLLSLWQAKLFPSASTMGESLELALKMLAASRGGESCGLSQRTTYSMADLLQHKDIAGMLTYREDLYKLISSQ